MDTLLSPKRSKFEDNISNRMHRNIPLFGFCKGVLMVVAGSLNLAEMLQLLHTFLVNYKFPESWKDIVVISKINSEGLERLLEKPIVFYCNQKSLQGNNGYQEFENFIDSIYDCEDIAILFALLNMSLGEQKKWEVKWVVYGAKKTISESIWLSRIVFLSSLIDKHKKSTNTVGRLDYLSLEKILDRFWGNGKKTKITKSRKCKNILSCLLKINPSEKKNIYAKKVPENYTYDLSYEFTDTDRTSVYRVQCPVCQKKHSFVLNKQKKGDRYTYVEEAVSFYETNDEVYVILYCPEKKKPAVVLPIIDNGSHETDKKNKAFMIIYFNLLNDRKITLERSQKYIKSLKFDNE